MFRSDTGRYNMVAYNKTGDTWHTFNIKVKGQ